MVGSGDLEQSLRAEIDSYINSHLSGLRDEVARLQSQLNEALTRLSERLESAAQSDPSVAVAISEHLRDARNTGIETASAEGARARASSDLAILKAAIADIDEQRTQADILNALVNRAANFAPRIAFFVIKNERATGWRARGLAGTVGDDAVREISLPLSADTLLSSVARTRTTWSGAPGTHGEDHEIYNRFGEEPPQRIVAIPLIARDKAVAILYADSAAQDSEAINLEAIETLVRVTGMAVELLATKRPAPSETNASATSSQTSPQTTAATSSGAAFGTASDVASGAASGMSGDSQASGETQPEQLAAHEPEAATSASTPFTRDEPAPQFVDSAPQAETVDAQPAGHTPPSLLEATPVAEASIADDGGGAPAASTGSLTASDTGSLSDFPAQASVEPAATAAPLGTARRYGAEVELPIEVGEGERRFHNDARRFARLLVSEIKLYNEQKVREGRAEGDLYNRLREDIDRSRQMYEKRVAPEVAGRYDYFHHELVNTLAEGDPSKLGQGYPGDSASA